MPPTPRLDTTYRQLARDCEALRLELAERDGGLSSHRLATDPAALAAVLDAESERIGTARRDVAASRFLHHYLWSVCLLFCGPWYLTRRVPRIGRTSLRVDPVTGTFRLAVPTRFACLPADPAVGERGVRAVAHQAALRAELRTAVAAHVGPVLTAVAPWARRGPRACWGMATDDLASAIWYLGRVRGEEAHAVREAEAVLPGATPPFPGAAAFRALHDPSGRPHHTRTRLGCCMYYAAGPGEACLTCPRTPDTERVRRLGRCT
jgi:hypothetical protein